jgi:hypothetical protein
LEDLGHPLPDRIENAIFLDRVVNVLQLLSEVVEDIIDRPLPEGALEGVLVLVMFFGEAEFEDGFHKEGRGQGTYPIKELTRFISPLLNPRGSYYTTGAGLSLIELITPKRAKKFIMGNMIISRRDRRCRG